MANNNPTTTTTTLDSLTYRSLIHHLQSHPTIQNIDIMNVAGFCRNCLSKWRHAAAHTLGVIGHTYEDALQDVYGMSYNEYKSTHQTKASTEALALFETSKALHANHDTFQSTPVIDPCCHIPLGPVQAAAAVPTPPPNITTLQNLTARILTCSDRASKGIYADLSGPKIKQILGQYGVNVLEIRIVADEQDQITAILQQWSTTTTTDFIITTGGTGLSKRDVTPEATLDVIHRRVPGIAELLRRETNKMEPLSVLSRGEAGVVNKTLIVNFPGSPTAVEQCCHVLVPVLGRAMMVIKETEKM